MVEEPLAGRRVRVEEAVARLFEHCRDLAGGPEEVAEVVVTVPPYYTFAQRRLLAQTLRLAGLEPLVLVNDLTAGACPHTLCPQRVSHSTAVVCSHLELASVCLCAVMCVRVRVRFCGAAAIDYASTRQFPSRYWATRSPITCLMSEP